MELIPETIKHHDNAVALIGWEEGGAGQIHSWLETATDYRITCFVNPAADPPEIDIPSEKTRRDSRLFDYPTPRFF